MSIKSGKGAELIDDADGSSYADGEDWYKVINGSMEINESHDQVFFRGQKCGNDINLHLRAQK